MRSENEMSLTSLVGDGNDRIVEEADADGRIHGRIIIDNGPGADHVWAGEGDDYVDGGSGNDVMFGQGGADDLFGDATLTRRSWPKSRRWRDGDIACANDQWGMAA